MNTELWINSWFYLECSIYDSRDQITLSNCRYTYTSRFLWPTLLVSHTAVGVAVRVWLRVPCSYSSRINLRDGCKHFIRRKAMTPRRHCTVRDPFAMHQHTVRRHAVTAEYSYQQDGSRTTSLACFCDHILLQSLLYKSNSHGNTWKNLDTVTIIQNVTKRSITPRFYLTSDLWPHFCWCHMCDSTQGSFYPSPMKICQSMWI